MSEPKKGSEDEGHTTEPIDSDAPTTQSQGEEEEEKSGYNRSEFICMYVYGIEVQE